MVIERNRRNYFSVGNILTILGMIGAIASVWVATAADNADTKRRVTAVESRQQEDRETTQRSVSEVKGDVKQIKSDVQSILLKLEAMQATQNERVRLERRRMEQ